jgi:hypothetical protein
MISGAPSTSDGTEPLCQFWRIMPGAPEPQRADPSANGSMPLRAYRYCEALRLASGFGWQLYPPINLSFCFDGTVVRWSYDGAADWQVLHAAQYPGFSAAFERLAPEPAKRLPPTCLGTTQEPGVVQIWSGYLARAAPGWGLLVRPPINVPRTQAFDYYEGLVETENWFGPLFINIRLTQTGAPVRLHVRTPLLQVQPLPHAAYRDPPFAVAEPGDLSGADWQRYAATMQPNRDQTRPLGHYAVDARKRRRTAVRCPR